MSLIVPSRRRFLLGAGAVVASAAIVKAANLMPLGLLTVPKLWGDGIHDDTAALQYRADRAKPYEDAVPPGGIYRISDTITYKGKSGLFIANCTFVADKPLDCALYLSECRDVMITHVTFRNTNFSIHSNLPDLSHH